VTVIDAIKNIQTRTDLLAQLWKREGGTHVLKLTGFCFTLCCSECLQGSVPAVLLVALLSIKSSRLLAVGPRHDRNDCTIFRFCIWLGRISIRAHVSPVSIFTFLQIQPVATHVQLEMRKQGGSVRSKIWDLGTECTRPAAKLRRLATLNVVGQAPVDGSLQAWAYFSC
jgi:hypothetical protein